MACPCCDGRSFEPAWNGASWPDHGVTYRVVKCVQCGLLMSDPLPSDAVLTRLYTQEFNFGWYKAVQRFKLLDARARVKELEPILGARVLDYGGGLGYFAQACREAQRESVTYDPYATDQSLLAAGEWDSVVCLHMLEHSNNLDRTVLDLKKRLAPKGRLILAVPNAAGAGYRAVGRYWVWAQPPLVHIFHFNADNLKRLLARHGFRVETVQFADRWDANWLVDIRLLPVIVWFWRRRIVDRAIKLLGRSPFLAQRCAWAMRLANACLAKRNAFIRTVIFHISRGFDRPAKSDAELLIVATLERP